MFSYPFAEAAQRRTAILNHRAIAVLLYFVLIGVLESL